MGLIDQIVSAESGGDNTAKNPNSSAYGPSQFINSTWLDVFKATRPDLAQGKSDQEILALRADPQLSREMTEAYAARNGRTLTQAGYDATPGNTYLAHFAGPQGAVSVLRADPGAPVSSILGTKVVEANPFLAKMTAGDLQAWASRKMGGAAPQQGQPQPQPATPAAPANGLLQMQPPGGLGQQQPMGLGPATAPSPSAQQQATQPSQAEPMPQAPPIFYAPRRAPDLRNLQAALAKPGAFSFMRR